MILINLHFIYLYFSVQQSVHFIN